MNLKNQWTLASSHIFISIYWYVPNHVLHEGRNNARGYCWGESAMIVWTVWDTCKKNAKNQQCCYFFDQWRFPSFKHPFCENYYYCDFPPSVLWQYFLTLPAKKCCISCSQEKTPEAIAWTVRTAPAKKNMEKVWQNLEARGKVHRGNLFSLEGCKAETFNRFFGQYILQVSP